MRSSKENIKGETGSGQALRVANPYSWRADGRESVVGMINDKDGEPSPICILRSPIEVSRNRLIYLSSKPVPLSSRTRMLNGLRRLFGLKVQSVSRNAFRAEANAVFKPVLW
jgi:hypothetical protein